MCVCVCVNMLNSNLKYIVECHLSVEQMSDELENNFQETNRKTRQSSIVAEKNVSLQRGTEV